MNIQLWSINGIFLVGVLGLACIPMPRQRISMLDIGQGDSMLFQDGTLQVVVDGGPGATVLQRLAEEMPWFDRKIDVVVATHYDRDHSEGLTHVLDRYEVGMVLLPSYRPTTNIGRHLLEQIIDARIPYRFGWYGQSLQVADMQFRVMSPIPGSQWERLSKSKSNNASIIMRGDITQGDGHVSLLLTGDAEAGIERQLISSIPSHAFDVDVLKVGHHGSKTSTTRELVDVASPSVSLVSVGADNRYGHPTAEVLERLTNTHIFRTDTQGTISFFFDGKSWRVRCGNETDLLFAQQLCMKK